MPLPELQAQLQASLPPELQSYALVLSTLLEGLASGSVSHNELQGHLSNDPKLADVIKRLAGTSLTVGNAAVSFGEGFQAGDITIGDVASGSITKFSVNHTTNNAITVGVSYSDARQIAQDIFDMNFYRLAGEAQQIAKRRADELINDYLQKLKEENPQGILTANDPDMQYMLFTAQREYARSGDKNLEEVLIDILAERSLHHERSLVQIALNEAVEVAPKLVRYQFDILSFMLQISIFMDTPPVIESKEEFLEFLQHNFLPFASSLKYQESSYRHLVSLGCVETTMDEVLLEHKFAEKLPYVFWKGLNIIDAHDLVKSGLFPAPMVTENGLNRRIFENRIKPMLENDNNYIDILANDMGTSEDNIREMFFIRQRYYMAVNDIIEFIEKHIPAFSGVFSIWARYLKGLHLTTIGVAIAYANCKRKIKDFPYTLEELLST